MFLFLSKLIPVFVFPLGLAIGLGLVALLKRRRVGRWALSVSLLLLWTASMPVVANLLLGHLEAEYPPVAIESLPAADIAIVLGGSVGQPLPPRLTSDLSDAADRILMAARLLKAGKVAQILVSGGNLPWQPSMKPEAQLVADLLVEFGVPANTIVQDGESRNTHENALNSALIMKSRGWRTALLVTSGAHMPRAFATFKAAGVDATPASTDIKVIYPLFSSILDFLPDAGALAVTTSAIKEWVGLTVYRIRGWA